MPARHPLRQGEAATQSSDTVKVPIRPHVARHSNNAGAHLADLSSDVKSATGPRWVSLSGLTIELMPVI